MGEESSSENQKVVSNKLTNIEKGQLGLKDRFKKLTPEKNLDEKGLSGYKEALDYAFSDEDINNIALTGVYGSGKSSVLESYKKKSDRKFLHISLAHFDDRNDEDYELKATDEVSIPFEKKTIEGKILNQLLHQINAKEIPQTIFRTKKKINKKSVCLATAMFILTLISLIVILNIEPWFSSLKEIFFLLLGLVRIIPIPSKKSVDIIAIIIIAISLFSLFYKIVLTQLNRKIFKGFSFKSSGIESDIEIFNESEASYFDKYLDDVLYLFIQSNADIIVFEDIDRFDDGLIFEKLKEINTLANNKLASDNKLNKVFLKLFSSKKWYSKFFLSRKRNLKFIYLIKDDLFVSKDRTKFFDFIVPTVPVITSTNSYDKLKEMLEYSGIYNDFDRNFLQKLSLYIDDMRLMKNIYNEYLIYSQRINLTDLSLSSDDLFAILTYKNIFPQDFSDLLYNKGFVYELFSEKDNYIKSNEDELKEDISIIQNRLNNADKEYLDSLNELIFLYLPYTLRIGNKTASSFSSNEAFVTELKESDGPIYYMQNLGSWTSVSFEQIEETLLENTDFVERKKVLKDKFKKRELQEELSDLRSELNQLQSSKLKSVITSEQIEEIAKTKYKVIFEDPYFGLIIFLVRNGYINEGYSDYITYFYTNSLRLEDKKFLRSITDEKALPWEHPLTNKDSVREEIIDRMVVSDFYQEESLNFDLFEYLLNRPTKFAVYIKAYLKMIKRRSKFRFIIEAFLKYSIDSQKNLILMLSKFDETIFKNLFFNAQASNSELNEIAICLLSELNENQLSIFENDEESHDRFFLDFLEQSTDLLPTIKIINDNMLLNIIKLSPKFKNIDFFVLKSKLRKVIYENWLYEINYENIYSAINYYFEKMDDSVVKNQAFTIITQMSDTNLLNYIESAENLNTFVEMYISNSNERIGDEPKIAYQLINNRFLNNSLTSKYIISLETNKLELNQITYDNFYPVVISNGKALPTETNIINYFIFKDNVWTNYLIDFIVHGSEDYSFDVDKAKSILDETGQLDSFINETVTTNTIPDVYYKDILSKLNAFYPSFEYNNISLDKVEILLNLEIIGFTESSLQTFRNHYSEKLIHFILDNIDPYIEYISEVGNYNLEEMSEVLFHSKELSSDKQKELINCFDSTDTISIRETSFESDVLTLILATHFDIEEIDYICEKYDEESEKVKKEIYNIISENLSILINDEFSIPRELLIKILADENFSLEDRQLLMSRNLDELDLKELPSVLVSLKLSKHATLFNSKNPSFEKNETNKNILSYLVQKRVISSFREIDGKYKAYNRRKKLDIEFLD